MQDIVVLIVNVLWEQLNGRIYTQWYPFLFFDGNWDIARKRKWNLNYEIIYGKFFLEQLNGEVYPMIPLLFFEGNWDKARKN